MFGFLMSGPVKEDAAILYKFMEMSLNRYTDLDVESLKARITEDFSAGNSSIQTDSATFHYTELRDFYFNLSFRSLSERVIMAFGSGRYEGFSLYGKKDSTWYANASDGVVSPATAGAKKLAETIAKMYANVSCY
jgi:hypothetical protein